MSIRGVLCFILLIMVCLAMAQACEQEFRLLEQAIVKQTEVLHALLKYNKEAAEALKAIRKDTESMAWQIIWKL